MRKSVHPKNIVRKQVYQAFYPWFEPVAFLCDISGQYVRDANQLTQEVVRREKDVPNSASNIHMQVNTNMQQHNTNLTNK